MKYKGKEITSVSRRFACEFMAKRKAVYNAAVWLFWNDNSKQVKERYISSIRFTGDKRFSCNWEVKWQHALPVVEFRRRIEAKKNPPKKIEPKRKLKSGRLLEL